MRELRLDASMSRSVPTSVLAMVELVRDHEAELADQLGAVLAVVVLHVGSVGDAVPGRALIKATDEKIAAAALAFSLDLVAGRSSYTRTARPASSP